MTLSMTSCYEDNPYWLDENIKEGGTYFPVIQRFTVNNQNGDALSSASSGESIVLKTQYWCKDEISNLVFYQTVDGVESIIASVPYESSFDPESEAQLYSYTTTVPNAASGTTVMYRVEVVTVYDLTKSATSSIAIN